jgi:hypothetical protein
MHAQLPMQAPDGSAGFQTQQIAIEAGAFTLPS